MIVICRTANLVSTDWNFVAEQEFENGDNEVLLLRDPVFPASNAFYRVTTSPILEIPSHFDWKIGRIFA